MIEVKLAKDKIIKELYTEDELSDMSIMESFYQMRKLKALIHYGENSFEVKRINANKTAYLEKFEITIDVYPARISFNKGT